MRLLLFISCNKKVEEKNDLGLPKAQIELLDYSVNHFFFFLEEEFNDDDEILTKLFIEIENILYSDNDIDHLFKKYLKTHLKTIIKITGSNLINEIYNCEYQKPYYTPFMIKIADSLNVFNIYDTKDDRDYKKTFNCNRVFNNYLGKYYTYLYKNSKNKSEFRNLLNSLIFIGPMSPDSLIVGFRNFLKKNNLTINDKKMIKKLVYTELVLPKLLYELDKMQ